MINSYRSTFERLTREKAKLEQDLGREREKNAKLRGDISSILRSLTGSASLSTVQSKLRQIEAKEKEQAQVQKKIGEIEGKISQKLAEIHRTLQSLEGAEEQSRKKQENEARKRRDDELRHLQAITRERERQARLGTQISRSQFVIDVSRLPEKIKVLFVAANPLDQGTLRLDEEMRSITEKIRASEHRDAVELVAAWAARPLDLLQMLNEHRPQIVHFSGHGSENNELLFQGDDGETKPVTKEAIVTTMRTMADSIRVVLFNACFSEGQAEAVTQYVDVAVAMSEPISDDAARIFAAQFYSGIGFGRSVQEAFDQAKVALLLEGIEEAGTPQLFVGDGVEPSEIVLVRP